MDPRQVTLATLAEGAAEELFGLALSQVLSNIEDPNAAWKPRRKITLEIEFTTDEVRQKAFVSVASKVKLAAIKPVDTVIAMGKHKGKLIAIEALSQVEFPEPVGRPAAVAEAQ